MKDKKKKYYLQDDEEKPFNMAVIFLERLNNRLDECNEASIEGDLLKWYRGLRAIYRMIHFKIKEPGQETEEEKLEEQFNKAKKILLAGANSVKNAQIQREMASISLSNTEVILDKLETDLNDLLFKYGLIFPPEYKKKSIDDHIKEAFEQ